MKYLLGLLLSLLLFNSVKADIPYMPLQFVLTTTTPTISEGDRLALTLTIKNTDAFKTYPVITPGSQNAGQKLIYFRVYDPAQNLFVLRAQEPRAINMSIKHLGTRAVVWLKPGDSTNIPLVWNDAEHFLTQTEAHHALDKPLFQGQYLFQVFYNPFGDALGDSLYHQLLSTEDEKVPNKINFLGAELSSPCAVRILKRAESTFQIDGLSYTRIDSLHQDVFFYYHGEIKDSNLVYQMRRWNQEQNHLEVRMKNNMSVEWLDHDQQGAVLQYTLRRAGRCPEEYYSRVYQYDNSKLLLVTVDTLGDGAVHRMVYDQQGRKILEENYSMRDHVYTRLTYGYRKRGPVRVRRTRGTFVEPCVDEQLAD